MIKVETLGMLDVAKVNPVLTSDKDVKNYAFITVDGETYLVANTLAGDDCYKEDVTIKAGQFLNGFNLKAWDGQNLVIDCKHVTGECAKNAILTIAADGTLVVDDETPASGAYFKVVDTCTLTGKAVKAKVCFA